MKIVDSRQKALAKLALNLGEMVSYRGRSQESLDLIWPYCNSDSIVVYRLIDNQNLTVVSSKGRLTPHQTMVYDRYNIAPEVYGELLKGEMIIFEHAHAIGLRLPALQEDGIKSGLLFPIVLGEKLEAIVVFISYSTDMWPSDTIDWVSTASAMIACAIRRTIVFEGFEGDRF